MTFGQKLKKLRIDNNLTQDQLAEKIYVTRTAISKWETDKGYPSIDSLKQLSNLFHISIDELISDDDVNNKRLLEEVKSRKFYWVAMVFLAITIISAVIFYFTKASFLIIVSYLGVIGYIVFAILSKPKYKRMQSREKLIPYIISRIIIFAVIVIIGCTLYGNWV